MWTKHINQGIIPTEKLQFFLEEYYLKCSFSYGGNDKIDINQVIDTIQNNGGEWTVYFRSIPEKDLILTLIYIFNFKISKCDLNIVLNHKQPSEVTFPNVYRLSLINLLPIFSYYEQH